MKTPGSRQCVPLERSANAFRLIVESLSEGVVVLDSSGVILYCNRRFAGMAGIAASKLSGRRIFDVIAVAGREAARRFLKKRTGGSRALEVEIHKPSGRAIPAQLSRGACKISGRKLLCVVATDMTARKRAGQALEGSERRYQIVARTTKDAIWERDLERKRTLWNDALTTLFGYTVPKNGTTGSWWVQRLHPGDRQAVVESLGKAVRSGTEFWSAEYRFRRADGTYAFVIDRGCVVRDRDRTVRMIGAMSDISQQKAAQEAQRQLSRYILDGQELERKRVARDLHDSVNQLLSSASYRLQHLENELGDCAPSIGVDLNRTRLLLQKAIREVRLISRNLRPSELDDLGLAAAIRSLGQEFTERSGIQFSLAGGQGRLPIPVEIELTIYRIIQEALANVERHSQASRVSVRLDGKGAGMELSVRDDGAGFDVETRGRAGWGLRNMEERAAFIGGRFSVQSNPRAGTQIQISIPFKTTTAPYALNNTQENPDSPGG